MALVDPTYCQRKILDVHGAYGARWLDQLPALVAGAAQRWSLQVLPPFPVDSYSYVATFLNDPPEGFSALELQRLLARRIAQIAEILNVDRQRVFSFLCDLWVLA